ncbi:MAG: cytochrome-c peroxidase [Proteobacteria bacterium]|nr:cytochrome-c peroxidase [Pseudomonadota bacterium]MDA1063281.1 cytochrome-c peroxidase [Pseudomonadota bacterium]
MKRSVQVVIVVGVLAAILYYRLATPRAWTEADIVLLESLSLASLGPLPTDPSNTVADDPHAAELGHALFFDARFSANGGISCATCHQPIRRFSDGLPRGQAIGTSKRNTPSIVGTAYSPWQYSDGRRDSLWSQALSPLEDPNEHGGNRQQVVALIMNDPDYRARYQQLFDWLPDLADTQSVNDAFANIGKALAAYERVLLPGTSRFDDYVAALVAGDTAKQAEFFSDDEVVGLQLFIGAANCTQCHNGPLLTNNEFHNTGVISLPGELPDKGRVVGVREVMANEFNCRGAYSDDTNGSCAELEFVRTGQELTGAFRTPSLRNLENTAPFMHQGQIATLAEVLEHYNTAPLAMIGHNEAKPLKLRNSDLRQLEAFLLTLAAPIDADPRWLQAPALPLAKEHDESQ